MTNITLPRAELQAALDALERLIQYDYHGEPLDGKDIEGQEAIQTLRARLAQPEPEQEQRQRDMPCIEADGCPTEKAVLQRFWRKHQQTEPEPVAWTWEKEGKRYFITHDPSEVEAYHNLPASTPLYTTPPQREYDKESDAVDTLTEEGWIWDGDQWQRPATRLEKSEPMWVRNEEGKLELHAPQRKE